MLFLKKFLNLKIALQLPLIFEIAFAIDIAVAFLICKFAMLKTNL
jgi:hypothetical protein